MNKTKLAEKGFGLFCDQCYNGEKIMEAKKWELEAKAESLLSD
jgi:hypothetical protein